ncbi:MAG: gamma-glutamyltransferase [Candidatus Rokuibacteriota bacterium]|nr:MAG: gamma-glutamyltransferase [Candidatus Rokubacteria bacterium]
MIRSRLVVTKQTPLAAHGMVAAEHPRGAAVGAAILARGGNAVDAAVATAFAMTVIEPFMSTIAGSGTMLVHLAKRGETVSLNFNGVAPLAAHETTYRVVGGVSDGLFGWPRTEGAANEYGHRAVAVPGSVAGLALALERYGTMALRDVLAPAIALARDGFETDWYLAQNEAKFLQELLAFPATAKNYLRDGCWVHRPAGMLPGDRSIYPDLARSLELIAREGPDAFYRGALGQALVDDMAASGGLIRREDLAAYRVIVEPALRARYRDVELALSPGPTGGVTALEILNILGEFPSAKVGWQTVDGLHLRASAVARAFRDRFEHLGDPAVVKAPWERLTSREYARAVAAEVRRGKPARTRPPRASDECTTHLSVIDKQRNMVALTNTAVSLWGSRVVVPGTGILLNNGMIWFDPEPGKPNSVGPGKRGLVNMVPALGFRRGAPAFSVGAPGGRAIISAIPQVISNLVDGRATAQAAVEAPRLHTEGGEVLVSTRVGDQALAGLARRGHEVVPKEESYSTLNFARPVAIRVTAKGLEAGCEQYSAAAAAGH